MISEATGQTYLVPQRQPLPQQAPQQAPAQEPSPWEGQMAKPDQLGQVEGLTSNYYNAYGRLKDFTETMWKDYGLDVTKPDFTQQGGGNLHQAFQAMDADLRLAANDLSQHKKDVENMNKLQAEGKIVYAPGFDPTKKLTTQMQAYEMYTPTDIADDVKLAIQGVSNHVYNTQAEANAAFETSIKPLITQYEARRNADPKNAAYYQRQIDALRRPTYETKTFNPDGADKGKAKQETLDNFYENWKYHVNLLNGNVDPNKITGTEVYKGETYSVVPSVPNLQLATTTLDNKGKPSDIKGTVSRFLIGSDGKTYAMFTNPNLSPVETSTMDASEVGRAVHETNPGYAKAGTYNDTMYAIARQRGIVLPTGEIDKSSFLEVSPGKEEALAKSKQTVTQALDDVSKKFDSGNDVELNTTSGDKITFTKEYIKSFFGNTTYDIEDADYKKLTGRSTIPKGTKLNGLTKEEILQLIKDYNTNLDIFNKPFAQPASIPQTTGTITDTQKAFLPTY